MRSYLVCSLGIAFLLTAGCGDGRNGADASDGSSDSKSDGNASADRPDTGSDVRADLSGTGGTGGSLGGTGGGTAGTGGTGGTGGVAGSGGTGGTGGGVDGGPDAGGSDGGGTPTCSDRIKNSDETDIDCGGHCGKCGPSNMCLVNADCTYACKSDKTCAACNVAADCPGNETECEHRTCTAGACGSMREAAGTVVTMQATGDCKRRQCAADGTVANVNDDTDVPEDRNPCTNDICTTGLPSHTMMPANSNCGGANHCNAIGQCVGCAVAADCPGTDTACRTRTCSATGVCGFNFTAANTKLVDPEPRNCKGWQCDGAGERQVFNDNLDLPVDDNVCTTDECSSDGTPSHRPVASGTACGGSLVCDGANNCVECLSAPTCPGTDTDCHTRSCITGQCGITNLAAGTLAAAQAPRDCKKNVCNGQGTSGPVSDDLDLPVDGNACTHDVCTAGTPSNPFVNAGSSCGASTICDGQGACVTCLTASSCPGADDDCRTRTCTNGACGVNFAPAGTVAASMQMSGNCKQVQCDGNGQTMVVNDNADVPADGNMCTNDICTAGVPSNPNLAAGTTCGTNQMCNGQGACVGCLTAANCGTDTPCRTFACTNNQCVVTNVAAGTALPTTDQTTGDCKKVQCDGAGQSQTVNDDADLPVDTNACTRNLCNAGVPSMPPEPAGTACSQGGGIKCNGSGTAPACVQCLATTDCSGSDNECHVRTCTAGVCGVSNTADGTATSNQAPQDCKKNVCMSGNEVSVNDTTDVRVDNNGCTMDVCTNGTPSNPSLPANSPCNESGGTRCNGAAIAPACVQCLNAGQCGTDSVCQTFTCSAVGLCVTNNVPNGTAIAAGMQITGDCKTAVCNGSGAVTTVVNNSDVFVDGITCTLDQCNAGNPVNPSAPAGTACSQTNGIKCDGNGACVACLADTDCGADTFCKTFNCSAAHTCGSTSQADGTPLPSQNQTPSDCKLRVCMTGAETSVNDDNDIFVDGNMCTDDRCSNGTPSNPNLPPATPCGTNQMCNASGVCVGCLMDSDCGPAANECQTPVCNQGTCGVTFANPGTVLSMSMQTAGDCKQNVCDATGSVVVANDDNDKPSTGGNMCLNSVCTAGVPTTPPATAGSACTGPNNATMCNGSGACVECLNASTCPGGPDGQCHSVTCDLGVCGIAFKNVGTPVSPQPSGDCQNLQCDGAGNIESVANDGDLPNPTNECVGAMCVAGIPMTPNKPHGTSCTVNGRTCDGGGACITSFSVIKYLTTGNNAVAVVIEERKLDATATLVGTTVLPTTDQGANFQITGHGNSSSEGSLSLSGDGRYLIYGGYDIDTTTAAPGDSSTIARVIARVDAAGGINTTTRWAPPPFSANNIRGVTSNDGTGFWAGGAGTGGGVWWIPIGSTAAAQMTQLSTTVTNVRWPHVIGGQLYASGNNGTVFSPVKIGNGLPTTTGQTFSTLTGLPAAGAAPFSFMFFDRTAPAGVDTVYIADGTAGVQRWSINPATGNWALSTTFNMATPVGGGTTFTSGYRGLAAMETGADITLITTTTEVAVTRVVRFVDINGTATGGATTLGTALVAAPTGQGYRGVAWSPHL